MRQLGTGQHIADTWCFSSCLDATISSSSSCPLPSWPHRALSTKGTLLVLVCRILLWTLDAMPWSFTWYLVRCSMWEGLYSSAVGESSVSQQYNVHRCLFLPLCICMRFYCLSVNHSRIRQSMMPISISSLADVNVKRQKKKMSHREMVISKERKKRGDLSMCVCGYSSGSPRPTCHQQQQIMHFTVESPSSAPRREACKT